MEPEHGRQFLEAGADLVELYTGFIYGGPGILAKVAEGCVGRNTDREPDFYLEIFEGLSTNPYPILPCWVSNHLKGPRGDYHLVVEIVPPIEKWELTNGAKDLSRVLLSPHYDGYPVSPVKEWPCEVYISRATDEAVFTKSEFGQEAGFSIIAWGRMHKKLEDVKRGK